MHCTEIDVEAIGEGRVSYDFHLFQPSKGEALREIALSDATFEAGPRDAAKEAMKRRLADALIALNPRLRETQFDYEEISRLHRIRVDEVYERHRHVELGDTSPETNGIQITLYDDRASVTIPFWHRDEAAVEGFREMWAYFDIITREAGYRVYDAQLDRVLGPADFDAALACYATEVRRIGGNLKPGRARRPWWKLW